MTFPQSVFPRTETVVEYGARFQRRDHWRDFPILRSSPLWAQTWVVTEQRGFAHSHTSFVHRWTDSGRWFPPLRCGPNGFGDPRKKIMGFSAQWRLYSSQGCRCATCLENAQAVELMLVGMAYTAAEDAWSDEHRCWFGPPADHWLGGRSCTCGAYCSVIDWQAWGGLVDGVIHNWALSFQRPATIETLDAMAAEFSRMIVESFESHGLSESLFGSLTNSVGTTGAALTIENLLEAQRMLATRD